MNVSLTAKLPDPTKTDVNGLSALGGKLIKQPKDRHVVIALVDCDEVTLTVDSGTRTPRIRVCEIEAVLDLDESEMLRDLLVKIRDRRLLGKRQPADRPPPMFEGTGRDLGQTDGPPY